MYKNAILVPDYFIINRPYSKTLEKILESLKTIDKNKIIDKAGFIGTTSGGMFSLENVCSSPRIRLCMHSLLFPNYVDAKFTEYNYHPINNQERLRHPNGEEEWKKLMTSLLGPPQTHIPFEKMIYYKYNASCDGWASAWQRAMSYTPK
jgi:hypothetical protein